MTELVLVLKNAFGGAAGGTMQYIARHCRDYLIAIILIGAGLLSSASAGFIQQGPKLVGTPTSGLPHQGGAVALSGDGNTAIVGGWGDNSGIGAAWIFTRSGGVWTQQAKLVGTDVVGTVSEQGFSVGISADGNTAIVGGWYDNTGVGAAWIFTRSGGIWSQQAKLVGSNAVGQSNQGWAVAISGDGTTVAVGGFGDSNTGAVWIFTGSGGVWSQQGSKLVATSKLGHSVALSGDGNTLAAGAASDDSGVGAVVVFTRSGGFWTQQATLVGTGAIGPAGQGGGVALSADGNVLIEAGANDNNGAGALWAFTRIGGVWNQQGAKFVGTQQIGHFLSNQWISLSADGTLAITGNAGGGGQVFAQTGGVWIQQASVLVGTGAIGNAEQGVSVALSADGSTAIVGGDLDNTDQGAAWIFGQSPPTSVAHDFNADLKSDILWRDISGNTALWSMNGGTVASSAAVANVPTNWSIAGQRAFTLDGKCDILWRDNVGDVAMWLMNAAQITFSALIGNVGTSWSIVGTADLDGDNKGDILWRDNSGNVAIWFMNGTAINSSSVLGNVPTSWSVVGTSNFVRNYGNVGSSRIFWRDTGGNTAVWRLSGGQLAASVFLGNVPSTWSIVGTGDFNGDGNTDLLWRDTSGNTAIWLLDPNDQIAVSLFVANVPTSWSVAEIGDFDGDGKSDILWRDSSGNTAIWFMNGGTVSSAATVGNVPTTWAIQGTNAD